MSDASRMASPRRPTAADVARRANVDRAVVSRVLNEDPTLRIRDSTRARVLAAVAELGFRPNVAARSLRTSQAAMLGFVIPDLANPIYATVVRGVEAAADAMGQGLLISRTPTTKEGIDRLFDLLRQGRVDGLLIAAELTDEDLPADIDTLSWLLVNRTTVTARRWVLLDEQRAMDLAVEHLVELGHRQIGHVAGPLNSDTARRRRAGYQAALARHGLAPGPIIPAEYTIEGGAQAMRDILALGDRPTAIIGATVASTAGVLVQARTAGIRVPDELSVIGIHDLALAGCFAPPLTTVQMPLEQLGRRAAQLVTTAPGQAVEETVTDGMHVVVRESTCPPAS